MIGCCEAWPNNEGGLWCWRHPVEVQDHHCARCENRKGGIYMIERIRSLLRVWRQLSDQEQNAVSMAVLAEIGRIVEEGNNEGQIVRDTDSTNGDDQGDPGANGADGYLGMVDDTRSDPVRCSQSANVTAGSDG